MEDIKTESEAIKNARECIARLMKLHGHKSYGMPSKNVSIAFQSLINQVPDKIIYSLLEDPNLRIIMSRHKPQNNDRPNGNKQRKSP